MQLPRLTHLQYLVMKTIGTGESDSTKLRAVLADHGVDSSLPSFYQLTRRLSDYGWLDAVTIDGRCSYTLTPAGIEALEETRMFYAEALRKRLPRPKGVFEIKQMSRQAVYGNLGCSRVVLG